MAWPRVLCWPDEKPLGEHQPRTGVMTVGVDHVRVRYCGRCGAIDSQRTLTREEVLHARLL